jgi:hypothetical protein
MVKRDQFTPEEVERLTRWAGELGFYVVYDPFRQRDGELDRLLRANRPERDEFMAHHRLNIEPATDDQPFFFQFYRWADLFRMDLRGKGGARPPLALLVLLGSLDRSPC